MNRLVAMDHEDRAYRFLGAMQCLQDLVAHSGPGTSVDAEPLAYMISLLNDEAKLLVKPERPWFANDDIAGDEDG